VIYIDTSVMLATVFNERRRPPVELWSKTSFSSRLLEYEVAVRLHDLGQQPKARQLADDFLSNVELVPLDGLALERVLQPFPVPLRTLDAIHLSTILFLQRRGLTLQLATYDKRLARAATALGVALANV
jgi:predicted nucleic acid-binding protein